MNDDFKKKLKDYAEGKLSENETKDIENELEKLEQYQEFLDELLNSYKDSEKKVSEEKLINHSKTLKVSKWKARIQNAFTVIAIFIIFTFISSIITAAFYGYGEPNRNEIYRDVVKSTIALTHPNVGFKASTIEGGAYFTSSIKGRLEKKVGSEHISVGEVNMKFLFNIASNNGINYSSSTNFNNLFCFPGSSSEVNTDTQWDKLEKLPEGTVAEAYIYLDKFYETDEILKKFKDKEMSPLWFAVDTGANGSDTHDNYVSDPIGFPYTPIWHHDDWIIDNRSEKKGVLFTKIVSESAHAPNLDSYGSGDIRNENFMKTLELIKDYESIAKRISFSARGLEKKFDYINKNGVKIYGVVVTGPTKELLKLKDENWVKGIEVGEVSLWNWR